MISKLTSYAAEAEILGEVRQVSWSGDAVVIEGCDLATANQIFERLSDGAIAAARLPTDAAPMEVGKGPDSPPAECAGGCTGLPERATATPPVAAGDWSVVTPEPARPEPGPLAPAVPPPPAPLAAPPAPPAPVGVPLEVRSATKFSEIVRYLHDAEGLSDPQAVVQRCQELRDASPVIQRVPDLRGRVERALISLAAAG